ARIEVAGRVAALFVGGAGGAGVLGVVADGGGILARLGCCCGALHAGVAHAQRMVGVDPRTRGIGVVGAVAGTAHAVGAAEGSVGVEALVVVQARLRAGRAAALAAAAALTRVRPPAAAAARGLVGHALAVLVDAAPAAAGAVALVGGLVVRRHAAELRV